MHYRSHRQRGGAGFDVDDEMHYPTRPVDKDKAESELVMHIKKATSPEETAPKQKHVRSAILLYPLAFKLPLTLPLQNVSCLLMTITPQSRSGADCAYSQSWLMKFRLSRR